MWTSAASKHDFVIAFNVYLATPHPTKDSSPVSAFNRKVNLMSLKPGTPLSNTDPQALFG